MGLAKWPIAVAALVAILACCPRVTQGETTYHALLIACDQYTGDNEVMRDALLNWFCWEDAGILLFDDVMPDDITTKIRDWAEGIDDDDVAFFYYSGHGGPVGQAAFDMDGDETQNNPLKDNDKVRDRRNRHRNPEGSIGKTGEAGWKYMLSTDDNIKEALSTNLPAGATLIAVFDMCNADEMCKGTRDPDTRPHTAILNSICEADGNPDSEWSFHLVLGLYDSDEDGYADAAGEDDEVDAGEWWAWANTTGYPRTGILCHNLEGEFDRPIARSFIGNMTRPPETYTGGAKKGYDGCGVCSDPDFGDAPDHVECLGPSGMRERFYQSDLSGIQNPPRYNEWRFQWLGVPVNGESITDSDPYDPTCAADGDGEDDADGVEFDAENNRITVFVSVTDPHEFSYRLDAWWDLNDDGFFDPYSEEHVINSLVTYNGTDGGALDGPHRIRRRSAHVAV